MKINEICLSIFILSISASGLALAEGEISGPVVDAAGGDVAPSPSISNLEGIWTFGLGASDVITAALYSSEGLIWGAAKSEKPEKPEKPEPMNGVLSGSISGDRVEIKAVYADGDVLTVTGMVGTLAGETIRGSYFQINSLGSATSGSFAGMRTSTDPSEREPISAADPAPESAVAETSPSTEDVIGSKNETVDEEEVEETEEETAAGFADVHQLSSGINPRILGYAAPVTGKSRIV